MVRIVKAGTAELMKSVCDLIGYDIPNIDATDLLTIEFVDGRIYVTQKSMALEPIPTSNED
jgi:hypothetical protein